MIRHDMAWHGMAWHGMAWHGITDLRELLYFIILVQHYLLVVSAVNTVAAELMVLKFFSK